jgi:hypothetical protein
MTLSPLAYPMITRTPLVANNLLIKTMQMAYNVASEICALRVVLAMYSQHY